jgi:hypothetical protein
MQLTQELGRQRRRLRWAKWVRKFQPSFSYQLFVRIVAATNSLPYLKDTTDGFFRRAIILELARDSRMRRWTSIFKRKFLKSSTAFWF